MKKAEGAIVPTSITRAEINTALESLFDLLGVNKNDVYRDHPIVIGPTSLTFVMAAGEESVRDRRKSVAAPWHPQGDYDPATGRHVGREYVHMVSVRVYGFDEVEPEHVAPKPKHGEAAQA